MMNLTTVPKSFQLMGHTYKVKAVKKVDKEGSCGDIVHATKTIRLKEPNKDFTLDMVEETFFHELTHAILDETMYNQLSDDEVFVERIGRALHQAFKSFKYHEIRDPTEEHTPKS